MKYADLHLHTLFSDGTYSPGELIREAAKEGLAAIAVADHDSVEGIRPTLEAAEAENIEVLPGIELTAEYDGLEIHILGYLFDYQRGELKEKLNFLKENRVRRIYEIVAKLKNIGIALDAGRVFEISGSGTTGRLHIARALVKEGIVSSIHEAFAKYIGDKGPAYVCGFRFSPQEAISLIRKLSGIPVLAHPYILNRDELIPDFVDCGLMGLEAYYPEHTQTMTKRYLTLANKFHLLVTGGSDCHGEAKPEARIGTLKIPYNLVEELKAAKERL